MKICVNECITDHKQKTKKKCFVIHTSSKIKKFLPFPLTFTSFFISMHGKSFSFIFVLEDNCLRIFCYLVVLANGIALGTLTDRNII